MKKTLKFLLAITLFVAILAIATGVNAAGEIKDTDATMNIDALLTDNKLTYDAGENTYKFVTAPTAGTKVKLDKNATVDVAGLTIGDILVTGNVTLKASEAAGAVGDVTVKGNLTADMDIANVFLKSGSVTLTDNAEVTMLTTDISYTIAKDAKGEIAGLKANKNDVVLKVGKVLGTPTTVAKTADVTATFVTLNDENGMKYYIAKEKVGFNTIIKDIATGNDVNLNDVELNKKYAIRAEATIDGVAAVETVTIARTSTTANNKRVELGGTVTVANDTDTTHTYNEITFKTKFKEDGYVTLTYTVDTQTTDVDLKGTVTEPSEAPATTAPATTAPATDAPNKGDKDETPKTGDQIIPATALLAVVVVANVVYFAKSKRS